VEGLALKARAMAYSTSRKIWEANDPREKLDFDEEFIRDRVEAVLRLAGVDRFGRPLGA
jgi:hypothetical protein